MNNPDNLKIHSLHIQNFKSITDLTINFDEKNLVVLDGPNGYGKTTVFEAIEIIFSKSPRKYRACAIDGRNKYEISPIHKDKDKPIELILCLKKSDQEISIKRFFEPAVKKECVDNNIKSIFDNSILYLNNEVQDEKHQDILEEILHFPNLKTLFNVLNYVEQDENTFFVKKDPKERYKYLSSLLGAEKEVSELEKIRLYSKQIKKIIINKNRAIENITSINKKSANYQINEDVLYKRLLISNDFDWDREIINNIILETHNSYLNEIGKIKELLEHRDSLAEIELHDNLKKYDSDAFITRFIDSYWHIENFDSLKKEYEKRKRLEKENGNNTKILDAISASKYELFQDETIIDYLQTKVFDFNIEAFKQELNSIIFLRTSLNIHSSTLESLKNKRYELIHLFHEHNGKTNLIDSQCPTCGYDWVTSNELLVQINKTTDKIFEIYNLTNKEYEHKKTLFQEHYLNPIVKLATAEINNNKIEISTLISDRSYTTINNNYSSYKREFDAFFLLFTDEMRERIKKIFTVPNTQDITETKYLLSKIIEENIPEIGLDSEKQLALLTNFTTYFHKDYISLGQLSLSEIGNKLAYVKSQYYTAINRTIGSLQKDVEKLNKTLESVEKLNDLYDTKIKEYTSNIVNSVSIPFYIFTGKILQNHSLGTGLVLHLNIEGKDPSFKITPKGSEHEVSYTISSGQLSATVVSLMLVLNIVYNKSRLGTILIDDPLQTLDEINSHSMIEVLKHNFGNQQIILSTHENEYSKLFRYKYGGFNLSHKNISLKNLI